MLVGCGGNAEETGGEEGEKTKIVMGTSAVSLALAESGVEALEEMVCGEEENELLRWAEGDVSRRADHREMLDKAREAWQEACLAWYAAWSESAGQEASGRKQFSNTL